MPVRSPELLCLDSHVSDLTNILGKCQSSVNKASLEMPIFRTIQAGPYHCAALTDDGRVFTWGKGKHGVLGQGTEYNHYEPVQVQTDPQIPVTLFCTGEYHSLVVQDADRLDMLDAGYSMRAIPNTDNFAYIPERDLNAEDLEARFKVDENAPIERYNSEGRTSKGKFSNLLGVTEAGKIVIDTGLGTEEVEPDEVNPARALSLRGKGFLFSHDAFITTVTLIDF